MMFLLLGEWCSGLLLLMFLMNLNNGFELLLLYYFNIVLNCDLMFMLCIILWCGVMIEVMFCYLLLLYLGMFMVNYLLDDWFVYCNCYVIYW